MSGTVLIRADASLTIGSGHVMRCLSLAAALRSRGARVQFASRVLEGHLHAAIRDQGYGLHALPAPAGACVSRADIAHAAWLGVDEQQDAAETLAVIDGLGEPTTLVVDHYALDARWQRVLRPNVRRIAVIDDLADRAHDADLLLNQNLGADAARYTGLMPPGCISLFGPRYALLREEFAQARRGLLPRSGALRRVLVFLGGVDAGGYTERAIEALALCRLPLDVDVVVGPSNPRGVDIAARCRELGYACAQGAADMAARMATADLAIGAGGSTTWERACLGLPSLLLIVAGNQRAGAQALAAAGCAVAVEGAQAQPHALAAIVSRLAADQAQLRDMATRSLALVDGRGAGRVARAILPPELGLRRALAKDGDALFEWRNHETVRRHSHSSAPIAREDHERWFAATRINSQRALLIAEHSGRPVGVLRYDLGEREALVSIYLVPGEGGQGYGPAILRAGSDWLLREYPYIERVRAEVHADNPSSLLAFQEAGYSRSDTLGDAVYFRTLSP